MTDGPFLPPARLVAVSVMQGGFYQQYEEAIYICMIFSRDLNFFAKIAICEFFAIAMRNFAENSQSQKIF